MASTVARSVRLELRATPQQENVLRRAAQVAKKSLTEFILDSACQVAEQALTAERLIPLDRAQAEAFIQLLDRPAQDNAGLRDLFSRSAPWES